MTRFSSSNGLDSQGARSVVQVVTPRIVVGGAVMGVLLGLVGATIPMSTALAAEGDYPPELEATAACSSDLVGGEEQFVVSWSFDATYPFTDSEDYLDWIAQIEVESATYGDNGQGQLSSSEHPLSPAVVLTNEVSGTYHDPVTDSVLPFTATLSFRLPDAGQCEATVSPQPDPEWSLSIAAIDRCDSELDSLPSMEVVWNEGDSDDAIFNIETDLEGGESVGTGITYDGAYGEQLAFDVWAQVNGTRRDFTITFTLPSPCYISDSGRFVDDDDSVFENAIERLAAADITKGCNPPDNDKFCPDDFVTRGQMAVFLARAFDYADDGGGDLFVDDDGEFYETAADRIKTAGVTFGCNPPDNDRYCGEDFVTRGQMAAFLVRALGLTDDGGGDLFTDDDDSTFETAIDRLGTAGITKGCNPPDNDEFCPTDFVTRGQMAAFLVRAGLAD